MADIQIDTNPDSPSFNDILVSGGNLFLTSGSNAIKQSVLQRLRIFLGEWFLDNTIGLPFFTQILVKNPDQSKIDAIFINQILGTPGIIQLNSYSFLADFSARSLRIQFEALTTDGVVNYEGLVTT